MIKKIIKLVFYYYVFKFLSKIFLNKFSISYLINQSISNIKNVHSYHKMDDNTINVVRKCIDHIYHNINNLLDKYEQYK